MMSSPSVCERSVLLRAAYLACTGVDTVPASAVDTDVWDEASRAGLVPLVASVVTGGDAQLPDRVRAQVAYTTMHHLRTISELRTVATALDHARVRWLVIKGPVLADVVYRTPGVRAYADLDVVVHPHDLDVALDAVQHAGAELLDRNWEHIRRTQQSEISLALPHGTSLDLHWHVISNPGIRADIGLDIDALFDSAIPVKVGGLTVRTLDPVDTLCYVALHAALAGGHQLRWLVDIQQCLRWAGPQLAELPRRAQHLGCGLAVAVMLKRVQTHLDPAVKTLLRMLPSRNLWLFVCAVVDRFAPLDPDVDSYSGRAVLSSTRTTTRQSLRALAATLAFARSSGRSRRTAVIDISALRAVGGIPADREAWVDLARSHARPASTTGRHKEVHS